MLRKVILYTWQAFSEKSLLDALRELGCQVVTFEGKLKDYDMDGRVAMELLGMVHREGADCLFSFNYFPLLSSVAEACSIRYLSWVYDSPHYTLFSHTMHYRGNLIFCFDRKQAELLRSRGMERVIHMPLASDAEGFCAVITGAADEEKKKYASGVSFVGSLYSRKFNYFDDMQDITAEEARRLECIVREELFHYKENRIRRKLSEWPELAGLIKEKANLYLPDQYEAVDIDMAASVIGRKVTAEERKLLLGETAGRFGLTLYTDGYSDRLPDADYKGYADYASQMPLVFHGSKINLNITLRTIESGIPLRALDIMACGGFLLSNYQQELAEEFIDGQELVLFHSLEDCMDKIDYYLEHEEERRQIAIRGQRKVRERFSFRARLKQMLQIARSFREEADMLLLQKNYEGLCRLCGTDEFLQEAGRDTAKAQLKILCDIYGLEKKEGFAETVFANIGCVKDVHEYFTKLKFYLRRLELGLPPELQRELLSFLDQTVTSRIALVQVGNQAVFDRRTTAIRLAGLLEEYGRQEDILPVLLWGLPREERRELLKRMAGVVK